MHTEKLISAIILAGGRSKRFGSPKAWAEWGGKPLIQHVADRIAADSYEVIAVFRDEPNQEMPESVDRLAYDVPNFVEGPLRAIVAGLRAMRTDWAFVVGCDAPMIEPRLMMRLFGQHGEHDQVIVPMNDAEVQPLVGLYHRSALSTMLKALKSGVASPKVAMEDLKVHVVPEVKWAPADPHGHSFLNINDKDSFRRLNNIMSQGAA